MGTLWPITFLTCTLLEQALFSDWPMFGTFKLLSQDFFNFEANMQLPDMHFFKLVKT